MGVASLPLLVFLMKGTRVTARKIEACLSEELGDILGGSAQPKNAPRLILFFSVHETGVNFAFDIGVSLGRSPAQGVTVRRLNMHHGIKVVTGAPAIWHSGLKQIFRNSENKVIDSDGTVIFGDVQYWHRDGRAITSDYYPFKHADMEEKQMLRGLPYFVEFVSSTIMCFFGASYFATSGTPSNLRKAQVSRVGLRVSDWVQADEWREGLLRGVKYHLELRKGVGKEEKTANSSCRADGRSLSIQIKDTLRQP